ncbi:hypothetical protein [Mycobacterium sp.]|uniref:hypothetical protein n=1 Tax=Mycobacterium sp. TaxID=1785 RepID=UPI002DB4FDA1|nr:hypothetical protein [Mycobacterium sp.]
MFAAVRPCVTAGAALVGAGVIAVAPIAPPPPDVYIANPEAQLAANPVNGLFAAIVNIPAYEIAAMQAMADALNENGPLQCYPDCPPNNYLGWEEGFDEHFTNAFVLALLPFPGLAGPLAAQFNQVLLNELPTNPEACTTIPAPCPDPATLFMSWWTIPPWELLASGMLDPVAAINAFIASLSEPSEIQPMPSLQEVVTAIQELAQGIRVFLTMPIFNDPANFVRMMPEFVEFFRNLFTGYATAPPPTFIPSFTPNPMQTFTIEAAPVAPAPAVTSNEVAAANVQPDSVPGPSTATQAPPPPAPVVETVSETVTQLLTPAPVQEITTSSAATPDPEPTNTISADEMDGGNKVEPGQVGGNDTPSGGGLSDTVNSVTDQINDTISNVTGGLTGGIGGETGDAE